MLTNKLRLTKTLIQSATLWAGGTKSPTRFAKIVITSVTVITHSSSLVKIMMKMTSYQQTIRTHSTWRNSPTHPQRKCISPNAMGLLIKWTMGIFRGISNSIRIQITRQAAEYARICKCSLWGMVDFHQVNQVSPWSPMQTSLRTVLSQNHAGTQAEDLMLAREW